jgi:hypothetical protein
MINEITNTEDKAARAAHPQLSITFSLLDRILDEEHW